MRSFHLVDLENILGDQQAHKYGNVSDVFRQFLKLASWKRGDAVVLASNHRLAKRAVFAIDIPHRFLASSCAPNAADNRLLDYVAGGWVQARFERVVVGSGDGAFGPFVNSCLQAGLETVAISRWGSYSHLIRQPGVQIKSLPKRPFREQAASDLALAA